MAPTNYPQDSSTCASPWVMAIRPFFLVISLIPVTLGAALSWLEGHGDGWLFALTLTAALCLHVGVNIANTYDDYCHGLDQKKRSYACQSVILLGKISAFRLRLAIIGGYLTGCSLGLYLTWICGWPILLCGLLGVAGALGYTGGPRPYKHLGLGPLFVYFLMGPLMTLPAYYIQAGHMAWAPLALGLCLGFPVASIMHANDIRDIEDDLLGGIITLSNRLGRLRSLQLFALLWLAAFLTQGLCLLKSWLPATTMLTCLTWPYLSSILAPLWRSVSQGQPSKKQLQQFVPQAAKLYALFGLLMFIGLLLSLT